MRRGSRSHRGASRRRAALLLACIAGTTVRATGAQAAGSPAATNALILKNAAATLAAESRAYGGRPGDMRAAITAIDLTGDGLVEWFRNADGKGYRCDGSTGDAGGWGQAGPPADIESGQPDGRSRQVFGEIVFGMKLERTGGKPTAWVQVGGHYCGQKTIASRAEAWSCELPLRWNAAGKELQIAPPSAARKLQRTD